jgi:acyl-coenzyme A thioesterase PaaI-like protein
VALRHHDLCFGCGQANLFGLQLELEPTGDGVAGRFFVKQDHQGPPGFAHGGVMAAALDEAIALAIHAADALAFTQRLEAELHAPAPIGTFVRLEARIDRQEGRRIFGSATAVGDDGAGELLASASGVSVEVAQQDPR